MTRTDIILETNHLSFIEENEPWSEKIKRGFNNAVDFTKENAGLIAGSTLGGLALGLGVHNAQEINNPEHYNTGSTMLGAGIGATSGATVGNYIHKKIKENKEQQGNLEGLPPLP